MKRQLSQSTDQQQQHQQRTLVIAPNWIGDAVMAQPLLQLLKQQHPERLIDVIAPAWVAPVISVMPEVSTVLSTKFKHGSLQLGARWKFARQLKTHNYSAAYVLPNTLKSALLPWIVGIPLRVGYKGETRYGFINKMHHDQTPPRAMQPFYAALAFSPKSQTLTSWPKPQLVVTDVKHNAALEKFGLPHDQQLVIFAPGAEFGSAKRWPAQHFAVLAKYVLQHAPNRAILLLGSSSDHAVCQEILNSVSASQLYNSHIYNLAGKTNLDDAIALLARAQAVVSNDSGLLHIASALNRPIIALYGPTDPNHAPPFSDVAHALSLQLKCAPCRQRECPLGHGDCMKNITSEIVWEKLEKLIVE